MTQNPDTQKQAPKSPRKQSVLGWLFSVRTDGLISPLARSTQIFLQILATTFAVHKLLPKDYPGLRDLSVPLSFKRIVADAWGNVEFTKAKLLQTVVFFAIVGALFFGALFVFLGIASVFVGTAHAQAPAGMFDPASEDVAYAWLEYLFLGGTLPIYDGSGIPTTEWGTRFGLTSMLAFYSGAILVVAALLLFYYLVIMVIDTAHKGVPMGNPARQVWAPIRLVIAIGLLVPISQGLSSGQYLVIKTAQLGSNLASQGWATFIEKAVDTSELPKMYGPNTYGISKTMFLNFACKADLNARLGKMEMSLQQAFTSSLTSSWYSIIAGPVAYFSNVFINLVKALSDQKLGNLPGTGTAVTIDGVKGTKYAFDGKPFGGKEYPCGWYFIPEADPAATNAAAIFGAHKAAFDAVFVGNQSAWFNLAEASILSGVDETSGGRPQPGGMTIPDQDEYKEYKDLIVSYQKTLNAQLVSATPTSLDAATISEINAKKTQLSAYGWAFAGAFVATIQRIQAQIMNALNEGLPIVGEPELIDMAGNPDPAEEDNKANISGRIGLDLLTLKALMSEVGVSGGDESTHIDMTAVSCAASLGSSSSVVESAAVMGETKLLNKITKGIVSVANKGSDWALNAVFSMVDYVASFSGVWQQGLGDPCVGGGERVFKLGVNFQTGGGSPFLELMAFGHKNVTAGLRLTVQAIALYAGSGIAGTAVGIVGGGVLGAASTSWSGPGAIGGGLVGAGIGAAAGTALGKIIAMILISIALAFLLVGFSFAYIMPMIPFVRFFFAVIVWLGEVLESVIAVPLIALAQLNPEGEGLPGQARQAYHFLFSIFLRPILTVFGLICGILLFVVAANFLTAGYGIAVAAYGRTAYEYQVLTKMVYTVLYTFMMLLCANKCFEMVTHIPNGAMEWMASRSSPTPHLGDIQEMQRYEQIIGGLATTKLVGGMKSVGFALADKVNAKVKGGADSAQSSASRTSGSSSPSTPPES